MRGYSDSIVAAAIVTAAGVTTKARGCTVVKAAGNGAYDVTLDSPLPAAECLAFATLNLGAAANGDENIQIIHTSDTVKRVNCYRIAVLTDEPFKVAFMRLNRPGFEEPLVGGMNDPVGAANVRGCTLGITGVGDYAIGLAAQPLAGTEGALIVQTHSGGLRNAGVTHTSAVAKQILAFNNAAAADMGLSVGIFRALGTGGFKPGEIEAIGRYNGPGPAAIFANGGVLARTALGVYTLTLGKPIAAADCLVLVSMTQAGGFMAYIEDTSDTVKTIRVFDYNAGGAGVPGAADAIIDVVAMRISAGNVN